MNLLHIEQIKKVGKTTEYQITFRKKIVHLVKTKQKDGVEFDWLDRDEVPLQVMDFVEDWLEERF